MTFLSIVKIGNPVLREKTAPIPLALLKKQEFQIFLDAMVKTMHQAQGVGLAANQVGEGIAAICLECRSNARYPDHPAVPLQVYVNPKIVHYSKAKVEDWEGCLSIPGYRGPVIRSKEVEFEAYDRHGKKVRKKISGFHARIMQHEVDHINGFFYIDRMKNLKNWMHLDEFAQSFGVKIKEEKK